MEPAVTIPLVAKQSAGFGQFERSHLAACHPDHLAQRTPYLKWIQIEEGRIGEYNIEAVVGKIKVPADIANR